MVCTFQIPAEDFFRYIVANLSCSVDIDVSNYSTKIQLLYGIFEVGGSYPYLSINPGISAFVSIV
jgi:hypothetical protein